MTDSCPFCDYEAGPTMVLLHALREHPEHYRWEPFVAIPDDE